MGKIQNLAEGIEVHIPILGCSRRDDCKGSTLPMQRLTSDVSRLDEGLEAEHGVTVEMLTHDRITFMAYCGPRECELTGECALRGTFVETTPEMITAQDEGLAQ